MKFLVTSVLFTSCLLPFARSAEEKPKSTTKEEIRALVLEDAKKAAKAPPAATPKPKTATAAAAPSAEKIVAAPAEAPASSPATPSEKLPAEPTAKLPQVEVNKNRITVLDHELHEQDRKIAFEAKNTKATEIDGALNSPAVSVPILGGYSTKVRTGLAQERIELMEFEKELTEAIARAKTKEEKAELKKQLEDIRAMRRSLDSSPERTTR